MGEYPSVARVNQGFSTEALRTWSAPRCARELSTVTNRFVPAPRHTVYVADTVDKVLQIAVEAPDSLKKDEVVTLYDCVGWTAYTQDGASLMRALGGSHRIVTARDDTRLIGLARSISDGVTIVYVQDVLVQADNQRSSVGTQLITALLASYGSMRQEVLITDTEERQRAFYESLGFTEAHDMSPELRAFVRLS